MCSVPAPSDSNGAILPADNRLVRLFANTFILYTGLHYIVNVKQLTSASDGQLLRQQVRRRYNPQLWLLSLQIKIEANNFALGSLIPGERYEMTIRSALSSDRISSTAAIVEIQMPRGRRTLFL
jgi:hypothetical protein